MHSQAEAKNATPEIVLLRRHDNGRDRGEGVVVDQEVLAWLGNTCLVLRILR